MKIITSIMLALFYALFLAVAAGLLFMMSLCAKYGDPDPSIEDCEC